MLANVMVVAIYLLACNVENGAVCEYRFVPNARVTEYVPEWGGNNCMEPCDMTAFMVPVQYGVTAACGPDIPYNTTVTVFVPWLDKPVVRKCKDRGGGIGNDDVDIAMPPDDNGYYYSGSGGWPVLWTWVSEVPEAEKEKFGPEVEPPLCVLGSPVPCVR